MREKEFLLEQFTTLLTVDGHSGAELLVESSCLDRECIDAEKGTGDIAYASVLANVVAELVAGT